MNIVSAYMIRMVADISGGASVDDIIGALKHARGLNSPMDYFRTRFVKIGNSFINLDENYQRTGLTQGKDYGMGVTYEDTYYVNGIAAFYNDASGVGFCLYKSCPDDYPGYPDHYYTTALSPGTLIGMGKYGSVENPIGIELHSAEVTVSRIHLYQVPFIWNVPYFGSASDASSYQNLVSHYWDTGLDSDLAPVKTFLENNMIDS